MHRNTCGSTSLLRQHATRRNRVNLKIESFHSELAMRRLLR